MNQEQTISKDQYMHQVLCDRIAALELEKAQLQADNIVLSQKVNELTETNENEEETDDHVENE